MPFPQLPNLPEESTGIRLAIVCGSETNTLADSIEKVLADAKGFRFSRFEYHPESTVKRHTAGFGGPDVVVAILGAFQATNTDLFLASLQRAFPHRTALVTTTEPDAFDFLQLLEMGASDFLLPRLRGSESLPRLMRQARGTRCAHSGESCSSSETLTRGSR